MWSIINCLLLAGCVVATQLGGASSDSTHGRICLLMQFSDVIGHRAFSVRDSWRVGGTDRTTDHVSDKVSETCCSIDESKSGRRFK